MNDLYNPKLIGNARRLRRAMTKEERILWYTFLRYLPKKFVRQKVIGKYIADFYCAEAKLVIELDGSQHFEEAGEQYDQERDAYLLEQGITVVRYSNLDVNKRFEDIKIDILARVGWNNTPSPPTAELPLKGTPRTKLTRS